MGGERNRALARHTGMLFRSRGKGAARSFPFMMNGLVGQGRRRYAASAAGGLEAANLVDDKDGLAGR